MFVGLRSKFHGTLGGGWTLTLGKAVLRDTGNSAYLLLLRHGLQCFSSLIFSLTAIALVRVVSELIFVNYSIFFRVESSSKVHPKTGREGPEG